MMKITAQGYGQFLINGVKNYTARYCSQIVEGLEHYGVSGDLNGPKLKSKAIWQRVKEDIVYSEKDCLVFDDSVDEKSTSEDLRIFTCCLYGHEVTVRSLHSRQGGQVWGRLTPDCDFYDLCKRMDIIFLIGSIISHTSKHP